MMGGGWGVERYTEGDPGGVATTGLHSTPRDHKTPLMSHLRQYFLITARTNDSLTMIASHGDLHDKYGSIRHRILVISVRGVGGIRVRAAMY